MHKKQYTYIDWLEKAASAGIDWENDPPPAEMLTKELCIASLQDAPEALEKIPTDMRTAEVCFAAVLINDDALQFVPKKYQEQVKAQKDVITKEQWLEELRFYTGNHYLKLNEKLLTPEFCRAMVECNGITIELVPDKLKTPELLALVKKNKSNIMYHWLKRKLPPFVKSGFQIVLEENMKKREE